MMKLLSPFATKEKQQEEITRKILRTQEVNELAQKANARLARAESDFNNVLALNKTKWAFEEEQHENRVKEMTREVEALENRKREALIPISLYKQEADKLLAEAQDIIKQANQKEQQVDYLIEKLENKLTEVADREFTLSNNEKLLEVSKQGIQNQQEATKLGVEALSKEMLLFHEKQQQEEASLLKRKEEVSMAEISFNAKLDKYVRDIEALKVWEAKLADERDTLKRAFDRIK